MGSKVDNKANPDLVAAATPAAQEDIQMSEESMSGWANF
jgi:hypothetical protein